MSELEKSDKQQLAIQAVGSAFAVFMGLAIGGPFGALAGAALTPFGIRWVQLATDECTNNGQAIAESAVRTSGVEDADEFFRIMEDDPRLTALARRILFAARMSANERKLRALGELLGGAVAKRGDRLDEAELLAAILDDIEEPQVVTLDVLSGEPDDADEQREDARQHDHPNWEPTWSVSQVQSELPISPDLALACLSDLVRHGLAETVATYGGGSRYRITAFGRSLAAIMARAAE